MGLEVLVLLHVVFLFTNLSGVRNELSFYLITIHVVYFGPLYWLNSLVGQILIKLVLGRYLGLTMAMSPAIAEISQGSDVRFFKASCNLNACFTTFGKGKLNMPVAQNLKE